MSRRPEGLTLDDELMVRKGEARAVGPAAAVPAARAEPPPPPPPIAEIKSPTVTPPPVVPPEVHAPPDENARDDLPVVIGKRQTIERVFTNVRIPVDLDERLFRMMVATRRKKQDLIESFIREGLERYENQLRRAGGRAG